MNEINCILFLIMQVYVLFIHAYQRLLNECHALVMDDQTNKIEILCSRIAVIKLSPIFYSFGNDL